MKKILVVDDDPQVSEMIRDIFEDQYNIISSFNAATALQTIELELPDLILLDIGLPDMSGYQLCQEIRHNSNSKNVPIIFLSAQQGPHAHSKGYQLGGDQYVEKPFDHEELIAIVDSIFRRSNTIAPVHVGNIQVDLLKHRVVIDGDKLIRLTSKEFDILVFMALNPNKILTREMIVENVWSGDISSISNRTIDTYITSIRKKIANSQAKIHSIYSEGYKLTS